MSYTEIIEKSRHRPLVNDVITLRWLPIKERIEFSLGKLAYNALKDDK